jgi:hypothetical protein
MTEMRPVDVVARLRAFPVPGPSLVLTTEQRNARRLTEEAALEIEALRRKVNAMEHSWSELRPMVEELLAAYGRLRAERHELLLFRRR